MQTISKDFRQLSCMDSFYSQSGNISRTRNRYTYNRSAKSFSGYRGYPRRDSLSFNKNYLRKFAFLQSVHKATLAMSLQKAIDGLPMPLHPGAARYYKEMGIKIPARLIAN